MKIYISADIEGVNSICSWSETEKGEADYEVFRKQMTTEVATACKAVNEASNSEILVKDAHDSGRNIIFSDLPKNVRLHRGWEGGPCSMMAGLTRDFDAVMFIGYHSPSRSIGNPLSHTMNTNIRHVKINGEIASEFTINSLYASYLNVPVIFLSGDKMLTEHVTKVNPDIEVVATKEGRQGAVISKHPEVTNQEIFDNVTKAVNNIKNASIVPLPKHFDIEIEYRTPVEAYRASFFPGVTQISSDAISFSSDSYYDVLVVFKYLL